MEPKVIGLAGKIGSGKTSVSIALANLLGWSRVGFGDYVRALARQRGLSEARETLQEVGESLVAETPEPFCQAVLAQANWLPGQPIIVDGIRHIQIVTILRRMVAPVSFLLVYIEVEDASRQANLKLREGPGFRLNQEIEAHSTEKEVYGDLRAQADLVVGREGSPEAIAQQISLGLKLPENTKECRYEPIP